MMDLSRIFQIYGTCNSYPWGAKGRESLAATLLEAVNPTDFQVDEDETYSELWFGDYPDFPARLQNGQLLADVLEGNAESLLGPYSVKTFGSNLPFLPKILSIAKALPLQIHPNKPLAAKLHRKNPNKFTDANHKPEMAVALSRVELFVGWKQLDQISPLFDMSCLRRFVPDGTSVWADETLREVVRNILQADEQTVQMTGEAIKLQYYDLAMKQGKSDSDVMLELISRLQSQHSASDPALLVAVLCINFLVLDPGQAIFIPAHAIHCYLSGDLFECMARSNNMLACGFCPTADRDDVSIFCDVLYFDAQLHSDNVKLPAKPIADRANGSILAYSPPVDEFDVLKIQVKAGQEMELVAQKGPTVAIIISGVGGVRGHCQQIKAEAGVTVFIAAETVTMINAEEDLQLYAVVV